MNSLLSEGFTLMWIGMGTVFVFLIVLVTATQVMSLLINRFYPEKEFIPEHTSFASVIDDETFSVIKEAIRVHRIHHANKR